MTVFIYDFFFLASLNDLGPVSHERVVRVSVDHYGVLKDLLAEFMRINRAI